jgi:hypothetical protein
MWLESCAINASGSPFQGRRGFLSVSAERKIDGEFFQSRKYNDK